MRAAQNLTKTALRDEWMLLRRRKLFLQLANSNYANLRISIDVYENELETLAKTLGMIRSCNQSETGNSVLWKSVGRKLGIRNKALVDSLLMLRRLPFELR